VSIDQQQTSISTVIFDWGGTLTPWHDIDPQAPWLAYAEIHDPGRAEELATALAAAEDRMWLRARDHSRSATLEELFRSVGVEPAGERHQEALEAYQRAWDPHTYIDPDVPALLERLRAAGLRLGVLSNTIWTRDYHEEVFRRDGVLELFEAAVYTSEIPWTKPHPEAFRAALRAMDCTDPASAVYVGDRLYDDIHGAGSIGMRTIHVPHSNIPQAQHGHVEGTPDATIERLSDVDTVIGRWRAPH
jgi:putative hydrolase of the HAD superfamily